MLPSLPFLVRGRRCDDGSVVRSSSQRQCDCGNRDDRDRDIAVASQKSSEGDVWLWGLVAIRLLVPVSIESPASLIPDLPMIGAVYVDDPVASLSVPSEEVENTPSGDTAVTAPLSTAPSDPATDLSTGTDEETRTNAASPRASFGTLSLMRVASTAWLIGAVGMIAYAVGSYGWLYRRVRTATRLETNVFQSEAVASPFLLGVVRPRIYVPYNMAGKELSAVLAHERAHIKRGDHFLKLLAFLLLSVYWFQPLLWVAYILLCRDIELACDERVVKNWSADERRAYSEALLASAVGPRRIAACPLAFGEVAVSSRIQNVMYYKKPAFWIVIAAVVLGVAAAVCLLTDPVSVIPTSPYTTFEGAELWIRMGDFLDERNRLSLSETNGEEPVGSHTSPEGETVEFRILEKNTDAMTVTVGMSKAVYGADGAALTEVQVPWDEPVTVYLADNKTYGMYMNIHLPSASRWTTNAAVPSGQIKRFVSGDVSLYLFPTHFRLASTGDTAMYIDGTVMERKRGLNGWDEPWPRPTPPYEENVVEGRYEWVEDTLVLMADGGLARYVFTVSDDGATIRHDKDRLLRHERSHAPLLKDGLKLTCEYVLFCEKQEGAEVIYTLTNSKGENVFTGVSAKDRLGIACYGDGWLRVVTQMPGTAIHNGYTETQYLVNVETGEDLGVCSLATHSKPGEHYPMVFEQENGVEVLAQWISDTVGMSVLVPLDGLTSLRNGAVEASVVGDMLTVSYTDDEGRAREIVKSISEEIDRACARTLDVRTGVVEEGAKAVFTQGDRTVYYADVAVANLYTGENNVEVSEALSTGTLTIEMLEQILASAVEAGEATRTDAPDVTVDMVPLHTDIDPSSISGAERAALYKVHFHGADAHHTVWIFEDGDIYIGT